MKASFLGRRSESAWLLRRLFRENVSMLQSDGVECFRVAEQYRATLFPTVISYGRSSSGVAAVYDQSTHQIPDTSLDPGKPGWGCLDYGKLSGNIYWQRPYMKLFKQRRLWHRIWQVHQASLSIPFREKTTIMSLPGGISWSHRNPHWSITSTKDYRETSGRTEILYSVSRWDPGLFRKRLSDKTASYQKLGRFLMHVWDEGSRGRWRIRYCSLVTEECSMDGEYQDRGKP